MYPSTVSKPLRGCLKRSPDYAYDNPPSDVADCVADYVASGGKGDENLRAVKEGDGATMEEAVELGKVEISLEGEKLRGGYALIRTGKGKKARWLLIKMRDDDADHSRNPVDAEQRSALTGRTMDEISKG